jgi:hypothetical protein
MECWMNPRAIYIVGIDRKMYVRCQNRNPDFELLSATSLNKIPDSPLTKLTGKARVYAYVSLIPFIYLGLLVSRD